MAAAPTHAEVQAAVLRIVNDPKTKPEDLIGLAIAIERHGHTKTGATLRERATKLARESKIGQAPAPASTPAAEPEVEAPESATPSGVVRGFPTIWKDVPSPAWTAFVKAMGDKKAKEVDPRYRLGIFGIGARRLVDLGIMKNPKKTAYKGQQGVWLAEWVPPHSEEKFLNSPEAQYRSFVASMISYRRAINQQLADKPAPPPVNGKRVTLSGLLAVAHHAGMGGLGKWLSSERRVPATTAAFTKATEIF